MMKSMTYTLHQEMKKRTPSRHLFLKLFDQFDYLLTIEGDVSPEYHRKLANE